MADFKPLKGITIKCRIEWKEPSISKETWGRWVKQKRVAREDVQQERGIWQRGDKAAHGNGENGIWRVKNIEICIEPRNSFGGGK